MTGLEFLDSFAAAEAEEEEAQMIQIHDAAVQMATWCKEREIGILVGRRNYQNSMLELLTEIDIDRINFVQPTELDAIVDEDTGEL